MPRFITRQRKHKVRQREATRNVEADSNQLQLPPQNRSKKEEKRRKLKEELSAGQIHISSKKQKRLDKYIENKLKKDENLDLLKKLSQTKFDTTHLQSSRNLGKRKHADFTSGDGPRNEQPSLNPEAEDVESSDFDSEGSFEQDNVEYFEDMGGNYGSTLNGSSKHPAGKGSGLKEPLAIGADGLPVIQKRQKTKKHPQPPSSDLPWEGFDTDTDGMEDDVEARNEAENDVPDSATTESSVESGQDDPNDDSEASEPQVGRLKPRNSTFKAWATQQMNHSLGYTPSTNLPDPKTEASIDRDKTESTKRSEQFGEPQGEIVIDDTKSTAQPAFVDRRAYSVGVTRPSHIKQARSELPIVAEEQKIMEAIHNNPVVFVCGATGSGKTTQVPQFLFEAGYGDPASPTPGMIGVTQPRRVAAVSMAKRVSDELGQYREKVSYQIRFDNPSSSRTAIKFMTDGILLRELSQDLSLNKYSVVLVDEAHERSTNTDILIGMLSRIVKLRAQLHREDASVTPLKLVIMSATLRISDFLDNFKLFPSGPPPMVQVEGRQYPVTIHFARQTRSDYLEEAFRKVTKAHRKLPPGGFLVFLTGQNEIVTLLNRLKKSLTSSSFSFARSKVQIAANEIPLEADDLELGGFKEDNSDVDIVTQSDDGQESDEDFDLGEVSRASSSAHILPLYSQLPTKEQLRIFEPPPEGSRLIVLATNIAETSLTIPGTRYVFDCGRSKERSYDQFSGIQTFEIDWISKASAEQRSGRAGRTGPGHCYRFYSSAVFERDFPGHADPEILRTPMEGVVLQMKAMIIENITNFPFPTPPESQSLVKAEKVLTNLGALTQTGRITPLGTSLTLYPLSPRFGKMMAIGLERGCLSHVITLVAGLAISDVFIPENQIDMTPVGRQEGQTYTQEEHQQDSIREERRKEYNNARRVLARGDQTSDAIKLLMAVRGYGVAERPNKFCEEMFLRVKALKEISQLRKQLIGIVRANHSGAMEDVDGLPTPSPHQVRLLNEIVTAGFIDQVAIRADLIPKSPDILWQPRRAIDVPFLTLFPVDMGSQDSKVYLHPSSILARLSPRALPQYIIYSHLQRSASSYVANDQTSSKIRMFPLTAISGSQLSALAQDTPLISYGKPIGKVISRGGFPERRECWVVPSLKGGVGLGWPLPARKVLQRKDAKVAGWIIEEFLGELDGR